MRNQESQRIVLLLPLLLKIQYQILFSILRLSTVNTMDLIVMLNYDHFSFLWDRNAELFEELHINFGGLGHLAIFAGELVLFLHVLLE